MRHGDWKRASWQQRKLDEADESIAQPQVGPGKRTLTMSLSPRAASSLASAQAAVQQQADPAALMQRKEQAALTEQWMDVALRPDLYDAPVQHKGAGDAHDQVSAVPASGGGKAMPEDVQAKMEGVFGTDFSAVRIHEGPQATAMGALAYTQGTDVHFAPGQYDPGSQHGQELLGHELTHVVQQSQGRVQATTQTKGVALNDDASLEREADEMGARAARGESVSAGATSGPDERGSCSCGGSCSKCRQKSPSPHSPFQRKTSSSVVQRSCNPGGDAQQAAVDDSPLGFTFLGEVNTEAELAALMDELKAEVGAGSLHLFPETMVTLGRASSEDFSETRPSRQTPPVQQMKNADKPIQRATVAGCNVPGLTANAIGIAVHGQIEATCAAGYPGCRGEVIIPGAGRADLVRNHPPFRTEIGEIKPASWLGLGLEATAEAQLAGYITGYHAAFGGALPPVPMWSVNVPRAPFLLNPAQTLTTWGPSNGIYYYSCSGGGRRKPVPVPITVPVPVPNREPQTGPTGEDLVRGAVVVGAGAGLGYLIYRGVRMIPSLFPPLWPTIPANLAIP